jgi:hypothetical protein
MSQAATTSLVTNLQNTDLFALAREDITSETGYRSKVARVDALAKKVVNETDYSQLQTTDKKILGAINEVRGTYVIGTLTAGQTSITLLDASITTTSTIDIYVSEYGIQPTNAVVATGSITLSFLAQVSDISVKVRVS